MSAATQKLHFSIIIDAPRRIVWECMLAPASYRRWTAAFSEGSYYEGSWEQGAGIRFLAPGGSGMVAEIAESRPHEFLSIRILGFTQDGVDDVDSPAVKRWAPAYENYRFVPAGPFTDLRIEQDMLPEHAAMMKEAWPKALAALKRLCEERTGNAIG